MKSDPLIGDARPLPARGRPAAGLSSKKWLQALAKTGTRLLDKTLNYPESTYAMRILVVSRSLVQKQRQGLEPFPFEARQSLRLGIT